MSDRGHQRLPAGLGVQGGQGLSGDVEDQGVQHANVVVRARIHPLLQVGAQFGEKGHRCPRSQVGVEIGLEFRWLNILREIEGDDRNGGDVVEHVHFEIDQERVGTAHVFGKGRENDVSQLMGDQRQSIAELIVVFAEKLGKVVQEQHEGLQNAFEVDLEGLGVFARANEGSDQTKGVDEQHRVHVMRLPSESTTG